MIRPNSLRSGPVLPLTHPGQSWSWEELGRGKSYPVSKVRAGGLWLGWTLAEAGQSEVRSRPE